MTTKAIDTTRSDTIKGILMAILCYGLIAAFWIGVAFIAIQFLNRF